MEEHDHIAVRDWLTQLSSPPGPLRAPPTVYQHLAVCPQCRGALLLLTVTQPTLLPVPVDEPCSNDIAAIAAFIDAEELMGTLKAARIYPALWWHLSACMDCATLYAMTAALKRAVDNGALPAWPQPAPTRAHKLLLRRAAVNAATQHLRLRVRSGSGRQVSIIKEVTEGQQRTIIAVGKDRRGWFIQITHTPPVRGTAALEIDGATFSADFDAAGETTFDDLPGAFFEQANGPDIICSIQEMG